MKIAGQNRVVGFDFKIADLLRLLVETGVVYASPADTGFRGEKYEPLRELPDGLRLVNVEIGDHIEGVVRFSLEGDNLPESCAYRGYMNYRHLEIHAPLGLASEELEAVRAEVVKEIDRIEAEKSSVEPITVN